jgi:hypothetical protein
MRKRLRLTQMPCGRHALFAAKRDCSDGANAKASLHIIYMLANETMGRVGLLLACEIP